MPAWRRVGIGLGIAALLLAIVGVALGQMIQVPTFLVPATATPTRSAAEATPAATGSPVGAAARPPGPSPAPAATVATESTSPSPSPAEGAAVKPISPPPSPRSTNPPGVLLSDDFEHPEQSRFPRVSPRPSDYTFTYDHGEYVIHKVNAALTAAPVVFLPDPYDNTVIAVDVRIMGDVASRYAFVVCRDQSTGGQARQYRASIVPDGRRLILSRWDDGNQRILAEARDEESIRSGNAVNRVELRCAGSSIAASVNGKPIASVEDMTLNRGDHGVGAGTFAGVEGTVEARFDNLVVRAP